MIFPITAIGIVLLSSGCAGTQSESESDGITVNGTLDISATKGDAEGEICVDRESEVGPTMQVIITNATGDTVGATSLKEGIVIDYGSLLACQFAWSADNVPVGEKFYEVTVGDVGSVTIPEDEISETVTMSLG
ncbi:hypothetical protein [Cryobacterium sp. Sr3]|uniref:hypothetical protein n=1 Tax=Cryobacterium sp. Sr3 TaxID=1259194 RepID=UPI001101A2EF|nr:hypothetical protein [Cryobacterium sp. Sr3]TFB59630.1 hypothetical protein E3N94_03225 [Cryobacterium sp. Sr3]